MLDFIHSTDLLKYKALQPAFAESSKKETTKCLLAATVSTDFDLDPANQDRTQILPEEFASALGEKSGNVPKHEFFLKAPAFAPVADPKLAVAAVAARVPLRNPREQALDLYKQMQQDYL